MNPMIINVERVYDKGKCLNNMKMLISLHATDRAHHAAVEAREQRQAQATRPVGSTAANTLRRRLQQRAQATQRRPAVTMALS